NPDKTEGYEGPLSKPQFRFFPSVFILFRPTAYSLQSTAHGVPVGRQWIHILDCILTQTGMPVKPLLPPKSAHGLGRPTGANAYLELLGWDASPGLEWQVMY
ncbi:MAG: hypothetical protein ABIH24_00165, partial [Verrucomicrobiota bacterium]